MGGVENFLSTHRAFNKTGRTIEKYKYSKGRDRDNKV